MLMGQQGLMTQRAQVPGSSHALSPAQDAIPERQALHLLGGMSVPSWLLQGPGTPQSVNLVTSQSKMCLGLIKNT